MTFCEDMLQGEWENNMMHGHGTTTKEGQTYTGMYKDGKQLVTDL